MAGQPEINIPRPQLDEYWKPIPAAVEYANFLSRRFGRPGSKIDFGGRRERSPILGAGTVGWEGSHTVDLEDFDLTTLGLSPEQVSFAYCRHTLEDLNSPQCLLDVMKKFPAGYVETPSPAAELTRGVEVPNRRGYTHHRWIVGILDGQLTLIPKYAVIEILPTFDLADILKEPVGWNTYYRWGGTDLFKAQILRHEKEFDLRDLKSFHSLLVRLAIETVEYTTEKFKVLFPPSHAEPNEMGRQISLDNEPKQDERFVDVKPYKSARPEKIKGEERYVVTYDEMTKGVSVDNKEHAFNVMIARFPHGGSEHPDVVDWLIPTVMAMKNDRRIKEIIPWRRDDTPITMSRNDCINVARQQKADFLLMIDSDMCPDCNHKDTLSTPQWVDPNAKKFWPTAWDFAYKKRLAGEPCVIGAPYCGPPPHENVYVFHWQTLQSDRPEDEIDDLSLEQYTRDHAAGLKGILPCAALPTGLIIIDMKSIEKLDPPFFHYEWTDKTESNKASTEDVVITRDLSMRGVEQYCNWDAWAGHWKRKLVGKPQPVTSRAVSQKFTNAVLRDHGINAGAGEQLMDVKDGKVKPLAPARDNRPAGIA